MASFRPRQYWRPLAIALSVLGLFTLFRHQYFGYSDYLDPDPDGYVSYGKHLKENWSLLKDHVRLPGYPVFLALIMTVFTEPQSSAEWIQANFFVATVVFGISLALLVKALGPFRALLIGLFIAYRSALVLMAPIPMTDFLYSFFIGMFLFVYWIGLSTPATPTERKILGSFLFGLAFLLCTIRNEATALLIVFLGIATTLRFWSSQKIGAGFSMKDYLRDGFLICFILLISIFRVGWFGSRPSQYAIDHIFKPRVALYSQLRGNTPDERLIKDFLEQRERETGIPQNMRLFGTAPASVFYAASRVFDDLRKNGDLSLSPYLLSIFRHIYLSHHLILRDLFPFQDFADKCGNISSCQPPAGSSLSSHIYYSTGFVVSGSGPAQYSYELSWYLFFLIMLIVGVRQALISHPTFAWSILGTCVFMHVFNSTMNISQSRYFLPFSIFIFIGIANGLTISWRYFFKRMRSAG